MGAQINLKTCYELHINFLLTVTITLQLRLSITVSKVLTFM
jgi:hypothetical protein